MIYQNGWIWWVIFPTNTILCVQFNLWSRIDSVNWSLQAKRHISHSISPTMLSMNQQQIWQSKNIPLEMCPRPTWMLIDDLHITAVLRLHTQWNSSLYNVLHTLSLSLILVVVLNTYDYWLHKLTFTSCQLLKRKLEKRYGLRLNKQNSINLILSLKFLFRTFNVQ